MERNARFSLRVRMDMSMFFDFCAMFFVYVVCEDMFWKLQFSGEGLVQQRLGEESFPRRRGGRGGGRMKQGFLRVLRASA